MLIIIIGIRVLTEILGSKLLYLNLSDNDLAKDNFDDFKQLLRQIKVPILKISDIGMGNEQMAEVIKLLNKQDKLSHLEIQHLESHIMSQNTAYSIKYCIQNTNRLNYLDLSKCGIGDQQATTIANGLKQQNTIDTLILVKNNIGASGAKSIKDALPSSAISSLDLSAHLTQ